VEAQRVTEQQRPEPSKNSQQLEESHAAEALEGKGKRAVQKPTAPSLIVTPPEPVVESSAVPVASKAAKKPKDSQQSSDPAAKTKASQNAEPAAAPKQQKDSSSANTTTAAAAKKTKSAKKTSKEEDASVSRKVVLPDSHDQSPSHFFPLLLQTDDHSATTAATSAAASAWASNKKGGREGNESKAMKLTLTEIQQQEEAAKKQSTSGDQHPSDNQPSSVRSFQLKNLLGVGGKEKGWSSSSPNQHAPATSSPSSLRDIQVEQERLSQETAAAQQLSRPAVVSGPPAVAQQPLPLSSQWKAPVGQAKSFTEIIEEEQRLAAAAGASQGEVTKAPKGGSWAAKAGGSKVLETGIPAAWIAGQSQKSETSDSDPTPAGAKAARRVAGNTSAPVPASGAGASKAQPPPATAATKKSSSSAAASPSNSDSIVDWSVQQLKRFAGEDKQQRDDSALIEFCLTLKSAVEIREYLADYLGSTPQVRSSLSFSVPVLTLSVCGLCRCLSSPRSSFAGRRASSQLNSEPPQVAQL
jgi:hypothetical protein